MIADYFKLKGLGDIVVVSPDAGGLKTAKRLADRLECSVAVLTKLRPDHNVSRIMHVIGDVDGKTAIIVDDIIDTAGSVTSAIDTLYDNGAKEVYVTATHGIFSGPACERIRQSRVKEVVVTDTVSISLGPDDPKIKVLSVADILARTIRNVFEDESVSEIFAGDNQLF
jgi:ribose-phosphate pyrophosphokinase